MLWFSLGSLLHTLIDIPTHAGDDPLLFFPFDWQLRFNSPLSYWDPNYFGIQFIVFEILLNVGLLAYLFLPKFLNKHTKKTCDQSRFPALVGPVDASVTHTAWDMTTPTTQDATSLLIIQTDTPNSNPSI